MSSVATFRFSKVKDSYAAKMGDARNVGVIGVAIFPERRPRRRPRPVQPPPNYRPWYGSRDKDGSAPGDELAESRGRAGGEASAGAPRPDSYDAAPEAEAPASKPQSESASGTLRAKRSRRPARREQRPGLGTEFGERRSSAVVETRFVRANRKHPSHLLVARYNDGPGLVALGIDLNRWPHDRDLQLRESASPFAESRPRGGFSSPPAGWR